MQRVAVIADPTAAEISLDPTRARMLAALSVPHSGSTLAAQLGLPRQRLNYHLRALERHGLVELVEERRKGNCTERVMQATAASYVISPAASGPAAADPTAQAPDQLSAQWLVALAARLIRDVGQLMAGARRADRRVATFAMAGEVRFASAAARAAFTEELAGNVTSLAAKYHDGSAARGRTHRIVLAVHPTPDGSGDTATPKETSHAPLV